MSLEDHLKKLICHHGPLSVARFMSEALGHPQYGYYRKQDPLGRQGDFITAPEISQMFGELVGIWCASEWQRMGNPDNIALVELGPGRGTLMQDLLRGTRHIKGFHESLSVYMVETSPVLTAIQQNNLAAYNNIFWYEHFNAVPDVPLLLVANEFFDALPVHQYSKTDKGWCEQMVSLDQNEHLAFSLSPNLASAAIDTRHGDAPQGAVLEICPAGLSLFSEICQHIYTHGGAALVADYGYCEYGYKDTLQAVKNHHFHPLLEDVGDADLTAHVDFTALTAVAKKAGLRLYPPATQRDFLLAMGIEQRTSQLMQKASDAQKKQILSACERLICETQMGTLFKVLAVTGE